MIDVTINTKKCKFCEAYEFRKLLAKSQRKAYPMLRTKLTAAIVDRTFRQGEQSSCGTIIEFHGRRGHYYKLNFCPECGKSLKRRSIPCPIHSDDIDPYDFSQMKKEETK